MLHDDDLSAEFGEVFGDFTTSGATAYDKDKLWLAAKVRDKLWREVFNGTKPNNAAGRCLSAGREDEVFGSVFLVADCNGMIVQEMSLTMNTSNAGSLVPTSVVGAEQSCHGNLV